MLELNALCDQCNEAVIEVETYLAKKGYGKLGVECHGNGIGIIYERIHGKYRLCVLHDGVAKPFNECQRTIKLRAIKLIPTFLEKIETTAAEESRINSDGVLDALELIKGFIK